MQTKKMTLCAVLTALALALGILERYLPLSLLLPLPGIKLGLANIVTLFVLYELGLPYAAAILLLRIMLGSIYAGSITSLLYALSGGALSLGVMAIARRNPHLSIYGVSVLGAAAHNIGQILAASAVLASPAAMTYLPVLLAVSVGTGLLIGAVAAVMLHRLPTIRRDAK